MVSVNIKLSGENFFIILAKTPDPMFRMLPFIPGYFYYISIVLQAICVIHCLRRGTQQKWIYLIVFLPLIGCIAYFFTEILPQRRNINWQGGLESLFVSPSGRIKRLEENLKFGNTFNNRILLADAYRMAGRVDEAIELYATSLTGAFTENEYVISRLIAAYFETKQYAELIVLARKIYNVPKF